MGPLKLLTVADVAERCQLGETAARDLVRAAGGVRLGNLWRIAEVDLLRYIDGLRAAARKEETPCRTSIAEPTRPTGGPTTARRKAAG